MLMPARDGGAKASDSAGRAEEPDRRQLEQRLTTPNEPPQLLSRSTANLDELIKEQVE